LEFPFPLRVPLHVSLHLCTALRMTLLDFILFTTVSDRSFRCTSFYSSGHTSALLPCTCTSWTFSFFCVSLNICAVLHCQAEASALHLTALGTCTLPPWGRHTKPGIFPHHVHGWVGGNARRRRRLAAAAGASLPFVSRVGTLHSRSFTLFSLHTNLSRFRLIPLHHLRFTLCTTFRSFLPFCTHRRCHLLVSSAPLTLLTVTWNVGGSLRFCTFLLRHSPLVLPEHSFRLHTPLLHLHSFSLLPPPTRFCDWVSALHSFHLCTSARF